MMERWSQASSTERTGVVLVGAFGAGYISLKFARACSPNFDATCFKLGALSAALISQVFNPSLYFNGGAPKSIDSVSPKWLTQILKSKGVINAAKVTAVTAKPFSAGQTSDSAKLLLSYSKEEASAPKSLVIKMSRCDVEGKMVNMLLSLWRECQFYERFSSMVPACLPVPVCYYASVSSFNSDFCLLISDGSLVDNKEITPAPDILTPAEAGKPYRKYANLVPDASVAPGQPGGLDASFSGRVTFEVAEGVLKKIATLHSKFWNRTELKSQTWLQNVTPSSVNVGRSMLKDAWAKTEAQVREAYPECVFRGKESLFVENARFWLSTFTFEEVWERNNNFNFTMLHGDFHGQNMLQRGQTSDTILFLDWQIANVGEGIRDVAYFISQSQVPYDRRRREGRLVKAYWDSLIKDGVSPKEYPFELCWARYKFWAVAGWLNIIMFCSMLKGCIGGENEYVYLNLADIFVDCVECHGSLEKTHNEAMEIVARMKKQ